MNNEPAILQVSAVHHAYGKYPVLNGIDLEVRAGHICCLLGPSGCGKTTLLRCIAGLEQITRGSIRIGPAMVANSGRSLPPEQRGIGLVFQDFALFPHRSVRDNIGFGLRSLSRNERQRRVDVLLERVRIKELADAFPHQLSGGQQQRVALARALAPGPSIMLMDEPFSGLDASLRRHLREETRLLLKDEQMATVMVTHDGEEALHMADTVALMREGNIVLAGEPEQVWRYPVDAMSAAFFGDCTQVRLSVRDGKVHLGGLCFPAPPTTDDGQMVTVVIRHGSLRMQLAPAADIDGTAEVVDVRFLGGRRLSVVVVSHGDQRIRLTARHDEDHRFQVGDRVRLAIANDGAFVFL